MIISASRPSVLFRRLIPSDFRGDASGISTREGEGWKEAGYLLFIGKHSKPQQQSSRKRFGKLIQKSPTNLQFTVLVDLFR